MRYDCRIQVYIEKFTIVGEKELCSGDFLLVNIERYVPGWVCDKVGRGSKYAIHSMTQ